MVNIYDLVKPTVNPVFYFVGSGTSNPQLATYTISNTQDVADTAITHSIIDTASGGDPVTTYS